MSTKHPKITDYVIVRDRSGRPVRLRGVSLDGRTAVVTGGNSKVGFPATSVFEFDETLFDQLQAAFLGSDSASLKSLWRSAKTWNA